MKRTVIESPFAGNVIDNIAYAKRCVLDCLRRGESPYASHLFFTQVLDDRVPEERSLGISAGLEWGRSAELVAVYIDRGVSSGMKQGIRVAMQNDACIEVRSLEREVSREEGLAIVMAALEKEDVS